VTIPNTITSIGSGAFIGCTRLTGITIPNNVTYLGGGVFDETTWFENQPDGLVYINKILYVYKGTMPANTVINNIRVDTVAIASTAFWKCTGLTSIIIPNSVTSIGVAAFSGCESLTSVSIPSSAKSIGDRAFFGCTRLTNIIIPVGVTSIGKSAFYECSIAPAVRTEIIKRFGEEPFMHPWWDG